MSLISMRHGFVAHARLNAELRDIQLRKRISLNSLRARRYCLNTEASKSHEPTSGFRELKRYPR